MARANRHFIPGYIWHLTHRCHKREFLLKFSRDRDRWIQLLFEARQRFGISILNYVVTSNHIHLIALDNNNPMAIPRAMQYVAGRTAQEYNQRKGRKGAFWEDRYHATAIESGDHLWQCLVYVDLNMIRAGVVAHPFQWRWGGYAEIQKPKARYRLIDHERLMHLLNVASSTEFTNTHQKWVESKIKAKESRKAHFTESLAVGSEEFVYAVQKALGARAIGREVETVSSDGFQLRESAPAYGNMNGADMEMAANKGDGSIQAFWNTLSP